MLFYLLPLHGDRVATKNSKVSFHSVCNSGQLFVEHSERPTSQRPNHKLNASSNVQEIRSYYFLERRFFM